MTVDVLYLPDPNNTYVLAANSIASAHTLNVKTNEGLLETVTFSTDTGAAAGETVTAFADLEKARIEGKAVANAAAEAKAAEKKKADAEREKALADAKSTLDIAEARERSLLDMKDKGEDVASLLIQAKLDVVEAETKYESLQAASTELKVAGLLAAGNEAGGQATVAYGPIYYRLAAATDNSGRIDLISDSNQQVTGPSFTPPKPRPAAVPLAYIIDDSVVVTGGDQGLILRIRANQPVVAIDIPKVRLVDSKGVQHKVKNIIPSTVGGATVLNVVLNDKQPDGDYSISIPAATKKDGEFSNPEALEFVIRKKK